MQRIFPRDPDRAMYLVRHGGAGARGVGAARHRHPGREHGITGKRGETEERRSAGCGGLHGQACGQPLHGLEAAKRTTKLGAGRGMVDAQVQSLAQAPCDLSGENHGEGGGRQIGINCRSLARSIWSDELKGGASAVRLWPQQPSVRWKSGKPIGIRFKQNGRAIRGLQTGAFG